jgi:hypothetical protein
MSPATGLFTCLRSYPSIAATTHNVLAVFFPLIVPQVSAEAAAMIPTQCSHR